MRLHVLFPSSILPFTPVLILISASLVSSQTVPALKDLECSASSVLPNDGISCTVHLAAPAPPEGRVIALNSDNSAVSLPASATVEAGAMSAVFSAKSSDVADEETAQLTASADGVQAAFTMAVLSSTSPFTLVAKHSGKCLDVRGISARPGAVIQQWTCSGENNQKWFLRANHDGSYEIQSAHSRLVLDVAGTSRARGVDVVQWPSAPVATERWRVQTAGNGYDSLIVENSGMCLDVVGGPSATRNGVPTQQWPCIGGDNQAWALVSKHSVSLRWDASSSPGVTGYYVYRALKPGGPYTRLSDRLVDRSYVDGAVQAGVTYYYATTATNVKNRESGYSNRVRAAIP